MAQEIQRKLEETEVKQKELENRGVSVEKSLRGEGGIYIFCRLYFIIFLRMFNFFNSLRKYMR
jgi:hypothetical protein